MVKDETWCRFIFRMNKNRVVNHLVSEDTADVELVNVRAWQNTTSALPIFLKLERHSMWLRAVILDPFSMGQRQKTGESDTTIFQHRAWLLKVADSVPRHCAVPNETAARTMEWKPTKSVTRYGNPGIQTRCMATDPETHARLLVSIARRGSRIPSGRI